MTAGSRLATVLGVLGAALVGWSVGGYPGAAAGFTIGALVGALKVRGVTVWHWLSLWRRRNRAFVLTEPITVANDRAGGGVRDQDGVAAVAVQVLGKPHAATVFTGSTVAYTDNTLDIADLVPLLRQSLGLTLDSMSLISAGARRRGTGDYPRVYDTLIGTPPYAGRRECWLILRVAALENAGALQWRTSLGTAAVAAAQRAAALLRQRGIRARVATATDIVELERRLGVGALATARREWRSARAETGWLTTYWYHPDDIAGTTLAQAWTWRVDGIVQNITVFRDGNTTATVTVRTARRPTAPPSVLLRTLPGEQSAAIAANLCGPRPVLAGVARGSPDGPLTVPVGPSGVLLGKAGSGNRLMLPLDDPAEATRVHIVAADSLINRILVRLAATGERITVHTRDPRRWESIRMPDIVVTDAARPVSGTTISVTDGTLAPVPRPNTVISVAHPGAPQRGSAEVLITQTGPANLEVTAGGRTHRVEVELFRAENRYVPQRATEVPRSGELRPVG